jgi:hypothetical protein
MRNGLKNSYKIHNIYTLKGFYNKKNKFNLIKKYNNKINTLKNSKILKSKLLIKKSTILNVSKVNNKFLLPSLSIEFKLNINKITLKTINAFGLWYYRYSSEVDLFTFTKPLTNFKLMYFNSINRTNLMDGFFVKINEKIILINNMKSTVVIYSRS